MKIRLFFVLLAAIGLTHGISFAQTAENSNPYAIFGSKPYIADGRTAGERVKVLIIENISDGSLVARLEHDTETGILKFFDSEGGFVGQKQLAKGEQAWPTQDRKAEKYYPFSPYAFTLNNPIRYIDPNGMDVWEMDYSGRVRWIEESNQHTMYALDKAGERTGQSLTLQSRDVFDALTSSGANGVTFAHGRPSDLASVFLFGADNTNVEWRFSRYNEGNGDKYAVGTRHENDLAINPEQMGFSKADEIAFIHSHPGQYSQMTGRFGEQGSMGWRLATDVEADFHNSPRGRTVFTIGDSENVRSNPTGSNNYYYTYFPHTGNVYHVRGIQQPAVIRNVKNHNYNPQRLFWGVLNGR